MSTKAEDIGEAIFNLDVASAAVDMVLPTLRKMAKLSWGPPGVAIVIDIPGMNDPFVHVMRELTNYNEEGFNSSFFASVAKEKIKTTQRFHRPSAEALCLDPAVLKTGDTLYQGGVQLGGLCAAVSGFKGFQDEAAAKLVLVCAQMICREIIERLKERGDRTVEMQSLREVRAQVLEDFLSGE